MNENPSQPVQDAPAPGEKNGFDLTRLLLPGSIVLALCLLLCIWLCIDIFIWPLGTRQRILMCLLLFALLSEVPFDLMYGGTWFYPVHQNVIWTLLLGLLGVHLMETVRKKQKLWVSLPVCAAVAAAGALLGTLGMTDYYGAGVLTVFAFYIFRGRKWWCLLGQVLTLYWINVVLLGGLMYPIRLFGMEFELCQQGLALLALVPIWLYRGRQGCHSKPFQYACYAFYPVHMLLLVLALNFVNR